MFKDYLASSKQNIEQWLGEVLIAQIKNLNNFMNL